MTNFPASASSRTGRTMPVGFGIASYLVSLIAFCYAVGFVGGIAVPRTVDDGVDDAPFGAALAINTVLLGLIALQHSVLTRPGFQRWWAPFLPRPIERGTYLLLASLVLVLLWVLFAAGWVMVLATTFMTNHAELFGSRQVFAVGRGSAAAKPDFRANPPYRVVRHPLMLVPGPRPRHSCPVGVAKP